MDEAALASYAGALALQVCVPGPATMAVVSIGSSRGFLPAAGFSLGVAAGDTFLAMATLQGLSAAATVHTDALLALRWLGAAYLTYLGVQAFRDRAHPSGGTALRGAAVARSGLLIGIANPKAMLLHASLIPLFLESHGPGMHATLLLLALVLLVNLVVTVGYSGLSAAFGAAACGGGGLVLRRVSGLVMLAAALLVLLS